MLPSLGAGLGLGFVVAMVTLTEPKASHYSMTLSLNFFFVALNLPFVLLPKEIPSLSALCAVFSFSVNSQVTLPGTCEFRGGEWWRTSFSDVLL